MGQPLANRASGFGATTLPSLPPSLPLRQPPNVVRSAPSPSSLKSPFQAPVLSGDASTSRNVGPCDMSVSNQEPYLCSYPPELCALPKPHRHAPPPSAEQQPLQRHIQHLLSFAHPPSSLPVAAYSQPFSSYLPSTPAQSNSDALHVAASVSLALSAPFPGYYPPLRQFGFERFPAAPPFLPPPPASTDGRDSFLSFSRPGPSSSSFSYLSSSSSASVSSSSSSLSSSFSHSSSASVASSSSASASGSVSGSSLSSSCSTSPSRGRLGAHLQSSESESSDGDVKPSEKSKRFDERVKRRHPSKHRKERQTPDDEGNRRSDRSRRRQALKKRRFAHGQESESEGEAELDEADAKEKSCTGDSVLAKKPPRAHEANALTHEKTPSRPPRADALTQENGKRKRADQSPRAIELIHRSLPEEDDDKIRRSRSTQGDQKKDLGAEERVWGTNSSNRGSSRHDCARQIAKAVVREVAQARAPCPQSLSGAVLDGESCTHQLHIEIRRLPWEVVPFDSLLDQLEKYGNLAPHPRGFTETDDETTDGKKLVVRYVNDRVTRAAWARNADHTLRFGFHKLTLVLVDRGSASSAGTGSEVNRGGRTRATTSPGFRTSATSRDRSHSSVTSHRGNGRA